VLAHVGYCKVFAHLIPGESDCRLEPIVGGLFVVVEHRIGADAAPMQLVTQGEIVAAYSRLALDEKSEDQIDFSLEAFPPDDLHRTGKKQLERENAEVKPWRCL
jgi:hypothetical protein